MLVEDGINIEYTRGICELIAEVDGITDMPVGERACQIAKEIGVEPKYLDELYGSILEGQPEALANVMPTFFYKDTSGRGETSTITLQQIVDWGDNVETNDNGETLEEWAQCSEIGDEWENSTDHYTRIS